MLIDSHLNKKKDIIVAGDGIRITGALRSSILLIEQAVE